MVKRTLAAALFLAAGLAYAQPTPTRHPPKYTVATAPSCVNGEPKLYAVTDAASTASCTVGGGSTDLICQCLDGTASVVGSGSGSGVSDGDKGDITVSGSGATWTIDNDAVALGTDTSGGYAASLTEGGAATTATALAANGANCSAGQFPLGVDASGAAESCSTSLSGNAATATALAANPADCSANQFAQAIDAGGALTCAAIADADVPDTITVSLAASATALAANGANCTAGQYPLGVDASGASESCTADDDTPDSDSEVPDAITVTGAVSPSTFTFPASAAPAQTTDAEAAWDSDDNRLTVGDGAATAIIYPGAHAGAVTDGGAATTATALAANGANCSAGNYPLGVDASGAVESCAADSTTPGSDAVTEAMLKAVDAAGDEECLTYESTVGDFEWQSCGTGIGGSTGATDNAILRADGTGGATVQTSPVTIADTTGSMAGPASQHWELASGSSGSLRLSGTGPDANGSYLTIAGATYTTFMLKAGGRFIATADTALLWGSSGTSVNYSDVGTPDTGILRHSAGVARISTDLSGIGALLSKVLVEANTAGSGAPNAIVANESGTRFTNEGATAENYENLPSAAAGLKISGCVQDTDGMRFVAAGGDTIRALDKVTAAAGYISSTTIGSCVTMETLNATEWFATAIHGIWTDGTWTYDDTGNTSP